MSTLDEKISLLIRQDFGLASVLHSYGIDFFKNSHFTLSEVCLKHGINPDLILAQTNQAVVAQAINCKNWPLENIIQYLQLNHQIYLKYKLPYIGKLIAEIENREYWVAKDLQLIFPVFAEDFIKHIHEEEDTLFSYIKYLLKATISISNTAELYFKIQKNGIQKFNLAHDSHDDEMAGIRKMTNNYQIDPESDLCTFVVFQELQSFEKELKYHAFIENQVLFPKALKLENEVKWRLSQIIKLS